ncbi:hypothetical protein B0H34DRAFT_699442 [Crassisporium funariophilum]|nr:hypothetical protein B0H34DRAFT_699442 [Crassisporium funariophilum]
MDTNEKDTVATTSAAQLESPSSSSQTVSSSTVKPNATVPYSVQFMDKDDEVSKARRIYVTILLQRTCLIIVAIFAIFPIYWGALWKVPARSLQGWIVDFDGDQIGQFVTQELNAMSGEVINWSVRQAGDFLNGPSDVASAVFNEHCWIAVTVNPRATRNLNTILNLENSSYNSSDAITVYAIEARNENGFRVLLRPTVEVSLQQITHDFAVKTIIQSKTLGAITSIAPEVLARPIYFTLQNVRPFDVPVANAVTFIGLIYLLILSFIVVNSGILARASSGLEKKLTTASLIRVRIISPILIYFFLSLAYTLMTLAFKLPFNQKFGHAGLVIFWMLSWFGMSAAGLALESMMTLLTMKYIQVFLILWIISNVAVCLWPIDALPVIFNYGHVAPFYQISRGVRTIVFSTKNELGLNFGVLAVWVGISCLTLPLFQWYRRKGEVAAWKASVAKTSA